MGIDPQIHEELERWADDELRSVNSQIEFLLRQSLKDGGRLPKK
ncbi:MAG: ribbon-helix-helix domain-containing protein [Candidatus Latescibacterota bacterium]